MIACALTGIGTTALSPDIFAESATWERGDGPPAVGRDAIATALSTAQSRAPVSLHIDQIVSHGKAATVSGRLNRDGDAAGPVLFCHILRFTAPDLGQIAQIVSFEQRERRRGPVARK